MAKNEKFDAKAMLRDLGIADRGKGLKGRKKGRPTPFSSLAGTREGAIKLQRYIMAADLLSSRWER